MSKRNRKKRPEKTEDVKARVVTHEPEKKTEPRQKPGGFLKNKNLYVLIAAAIVIVVIVVLGMRSLSPPGGSGTVNLTGNVVQAGDKINVTYTGKLATGEVFDSGTMEFNVGSGEMIPGFDEAVAGMRVGEEKTVTIPPDKAYGVPDPTRIMSIPVVQGILKGLNITVEQFNGTFAVQPEVGKTYNDDRLMMPLKVTSVVGNKTVFLEWAANPGDLIQAGEPWEISVIASNATWITMKRNVTDGMNIMTVLGERQISVRGGEIVIDMNHELAGKTLTFTIKVLSDTKTSKLEQVCSKVNLPKSDKPVMDVFVMSYCPFGLQMEKGVIPVKELFGDKIDVKIMFVNYAMHGKKEIDENTLEYCIQKEQPGKFWAYLKCFVGSGVSSDCVTQSGVDKTKADACVAATDTAFNITGLYNDRSTWSGGQYPLYMVNNLENEQYQVGGSPTVIINGNAASIYPRSPEDVKNNICCTFNTMPAECDRALSAANPSSGFGWSADLNTGTGGGAATCG